MRLRAQLACSKYGDVFLLADPIPGFGLCVERNHDPRRRAGLCHFDIACPLVLVVKDSVGGLGHSLNIPLWFRGVSPLGGSDGVSSRLPSLAGVRQGREAITEQRPGRYGH
jgi:hypothetical protein